MKDALRSRIFPPWPRLATFFFFKGSAAHRVLPSSPTRRSPDLREQRVHVWNCEHHVGRLAELPLARRDKGDDRRPAGLHFHQVAHRLLVQAIARRQHEKTVRDRKSTRLNSSHDQISYAVFCLKK